MDASIYVVIISGTVLLLLVGLFYIEDKRNRRFAPRMRRFLDTVVLYIGGIGKTVLPHVGTGSIRIIFHFVLNRVINIMLWLLAIIESYFLKLQMRNKKIARSVYKERVGTHFQAVHAHKAAMSLTPEEKQALKEKSLENASV